MMRMLVILTSVFLRYFKANWEESEYTLIKKKIVLWLKNETYKMSLCRKMLLQKEKHIKEIWILIYIITFGESLFCEKGLVKVV